MRAEELPGVPAAFDQANLERAVADIPCQRPLAFRFTEVFDV
jgi:hypothetical protein